MLRPHLLQLAAWSLLCLPSCVAWERQQDVRISSDPLGARIYVDGVDTGHTTPHRLAIGSAVGGDHVVRLEKQGYHPASRTLYQHLEGYTSKWIDGAYEMALTPLPLFWTTGDTLLPFAARSVIAPSDLHVRLQPDDEPLLGFDLLREQAAGQPAEQGRRP